MEETFHTANRFSFPGRLIHCDTEAMSEQFLVDKAPWYGKRLLSLSGLKKDYFRDGKLTESSRFCLFTLSVGKKRGCVGKEKCSEGLF